MDELVSEEDFISLFMPSESQGNRIGNITAALLFESFDYNKNESIGVSDFTDHLI